MPNQRSRTRAVIPGKAILGASGAAAAERKTQGGAVVPGRRILGSEAEQEQARALAAGAVKAKADPKQATGPKPKPVAPATPGSAAVPPVKSPAQIARTAKPVPPPSLSEGQAIAMLEADPESWETVLDLEAERPDNIRPATAAAILRLAPTITAHPVPAEVLAALRTLAGDAFATAPGSDANGPSA